MEKHWPQEKAEKHLKIASFLIIAGGIAGLIMGLDDFITLGRRISAFIWPYFYNIIAVCVSIFQITVGIAFFKRQIWAKTAIFYIIGVRFLFCFFDYGEVFGALILLIYLMFVIHPNKLGALFKKKEIFS